MRICIARWWLVAGCTLVGVVGEVAPARGDELAGPVEKIPSGRTVFFAAELGTTPDILGMGFERNLSTTDANGDTHRVHPAKHVEVPVNQYAAKFDVVDNSLMFEAHGRYLFVETGVKVSKNRRYMVARVYQVNKVAKLVTEGKPTGNAPMFASKIYYGWALYVVIEGEEAAFTAAVAANLAAAGGKLGTAITSSKLSSHVHLIGLKPKNEGDIPIAVTVDDVQASFDTFAEPQPIFVEYTLMQDMVVDAIPWMKNEFKPGRYFAKVDLSVMDQKADGRNWDAGSMPDPLVTLFVNGKRATSCKQQDSMESRCIHDIAIDVDQNTVINLLAVDKDVASDDAIGATEGLQVMASGGTPGAEIQLKATGQIRWAKITLTPVP